MTQFFANAAASHFAQAACAAFSCSDMNSMIILDASLILLVSFIILSLAVLLRNKTARPNHDATSTSLPILRTR